MTLTPYLGLSNAWRPSLHRYRYKGARVLELDFLHLYVGLVIRP